MGEGPEPVTAPAWTGDALFALLGELRAQGFPIGVGEYLEAQAAAAACHRDGLGGDPRRLRNYLAPVLCTNLEQQQAFYRHFDAWWIDRAGGVQEDLAPPPLPPPPLHESELGAVARSTRPWKWWAAAVLGASAVVAGLVWGQDLAALWRRTPVGLTPEAGSPGSTVQAGPALYGNQPAMPASGKTEKLKPSMDRKAAITPESAAPAPDGSDLTLKIRVADLAGRPVPGTTAAMVHAAGEPIATIQHDGLVTAAAFSPDESRVVTTLQDGTARIWNAANGELTALDGHTGKIQDATFSPDGSRIVTASADATARIWDAVTGKSVAILKGHTGTVRTASFSPDGSRVLTTSEDRTARIWNAATGLAVSLLKGHTASVLAAAFSPDGRWIVTASADQTARIWDSAAGKPTSTLKGHTAPVLAVSFSPAGSRVVTVSQDGTARAWDLSGRPSGQPFRYGIKISSASSSRDGAWVVTTSGDGTASLWDTAAGRPPGRPIQVPKADYAALSPDGALLITASRGTAQIWSVAAIVHPSTRELRGASDQNGELSFPLDPSMAPQALSFTHGGHASPRRYLAPLSSAGGTLHVSLAPLSLWDRLMQYQVKVQAGLALLPLAVAGPWLTWRVRRRRQLVLERRAIRGERATASIPLPEPRHELYRGASFSRAQVEMRRRLRAGSGDFDAEASALATARRVGFFTPVFRDRLEVPVYLALIDRAGFRDQRALMVDLLLDRLQAGGVDFDRYDFDRDPRRAALRGASEVRRDLQELAGQYPGHRLAIFADGAGFADPATGRLAPWVELLAAWPQRTLLTPVPVCDWGRRELDLAAAGFAVLPASAPGIERLADALQGEKGTVPRPLAAAWQPPYPDLLAARPHRFLERHAPERRSLDGLCAELAFYLGPDGYRWLRALAVYPELDWYLTLYLGLLLRRGDGRAVLDEATLTALTRLPWLRHGSMPDWLRLRLLCDLSADDEKAVRDWLRQLLQQRETAGSRFRLDVARPPEPETRGLRGRLRRWKENRDWRRLIKDLAHAEAKDGPLRDQVFVTFLLGRKPGKLQVRAPSPWKRWAWEQGLRALGPRTGSVVVLTLLSSLLGLVLGGPDLEYMANKTSQAWKSGVTLEPLPAQASQVSPEPGPPQTFGAPVKPPSDGAQVVAPQDAWEITRHSLAAKVRGLRLPKKQAAMKETAVVDIEHGQMGAALPLVQSFAINDNQPQAATWKNIVTALQNFVEPNTLAYDVRGLVLPTKQAAMQETAAKDIENGKLAEALPLVQSFEIADNQAQASMWKYVIATLQEAAAQPKEGLPAEVLAHLLGPSCLHDMVCFVTLRNRDSNLCLGSDKQSGQSSELRLTPCDGATFAQWRIVDEKESVQIISKESNFCLGDPNGKAGGSVTVHSCDQGTEDRWRLLSFDLSKQIMFKNEKSGLCLGVRGNNRPKAGATAELNDCAAGLENRLYSRWSLVNAGGRMLPQKQN
jgi:Ricin-type beta-trefoil lectin domain/WD domain, G-beta repeat